MPTLTRATSAKLGRRHRTTPEYADVLVRLVRRWQPDRDIVVVGDSAFAVVELGAHQPSAPDAAGLSPGVQRAAV